MIRSPLLYRTRTRVGWLAVGGVCAAFSLAALWAMTRFSDLVVPTSGATLAVGALALVYGWLGFGALRMGLTRRFEAVADDDTLAIFHSGVVREPVIVERDQIEAAHVDLRPWAQRGVAVATRRGGVAAPSLLDASLPVISAAPSAHSVYGSAAAPNLVVRFREPRQLPPPAASARVLIRIATGRAGRYAGPRRGRAVAGLRLVLDDPVMLAEVLRGWGVLADAPRDEAYLAPREERNYQRVRRERLIVAVGAGIMIALLVLGWRLG